MASPRWGPVAPIDPIVGNNFGLDQAQCLDDGCSLSDRRSLQSFGGFKTICETNLEGVVKECCPEKLKEVEYKPLDGLVPVYVKENTDGSFSNCYHDLTQDIQTDMLKVINDPSYNYKDRGISYEERLRRYRVQQGLLSDIVSNSKLGRTCNLKSGNTTNDWTTYDTSDKINLCLNNVCPTQGYRLAENQYEVCKSAGDVLTMKSRGPCKEKCGDTSRDSQSPETAKDTNTQLPPNIKEWKDKVNVLLGKLETDLTIMKAKDRGRFAQMTQNQNMMSNGVSSTANNYYDSLVLPLHQPGRGKYGGFVIAGYLQSVTDSNNMMPLYARRIGPHQYEYYTTNLINPQLRIPIINGNGIELRRGSIINVSGYSQNFRVILYGPDYQSYAPY